VTSVIDTHAHLFFEALLGSVGDLGPSLTRDAAGVATLTTGGFAYRLGKIPGLDRSPKQRLDEMNEAGIEVQVVSASPLWYFSHTPAKVAGRFASSYNELLSEWTSADPTRLKALATLPVRDVGAAVRELERAVRDLNVVGAVIGTDAADDLDHPDLDDLYAACTDLDVPLFVHSVVPGIDGPDGDPRLRRWLRDVTLGYPFEETIATTSLLLGGVLRRHPELDICLSHGGGAAPFLFGRVRAWVATGAAPVRLAQFDEDYSRLWFDVHVHSDESADLLIETANPERLVLGTNFGGWDSSSPADVERLPVDLAANARRLLRL
jgi:aminocarboxymuconate-semialdehyde decarboxylase